MTYPFTQLGVELRERICEVGHATPGFTTEVVEFPFVGRHAAFPTMPGHVGLLKVQALL